MPIKEGGKKHSAGEVLCRLFVILIGKRKKFVIPNVNVLVIQIKGPIPIIEVVQNILFGLDVED